ncbi:BRO-N domain protein [Catovirus CTV1]|uniref:BRO-N domain protein n=1 Tax=Catovirus CTV1 TaxID=1977631 RepID=A0A1V0S8D5_9VIRU|nr:BRO-N domain protein [Catovirus CTV1]
MAQKLIDLYRHMLQYDDKIVYIAFDKNSDPYFNANQLCKMLEYVDCKDAIGKYVKKQDMYQLKDITRNYKSLYKNVQANTKFLNEAGMYSLILSSKMKKATEIKDWITHDVMPSLRKYGEYKANSKLKKQIDELNKIIIDQQNQIQVLKYNLKTTKFKKGGAVYILRVITDSLDFDQDETLYLKFGKTRDMNTRKPNYDTCTHNKVQVLKMIDTDDPDHMEKCVIKKMHKYQIKNRKEYFECSYKQLINEIATCIKFYEDKDIDKEPDILNENNRQKYNDFDTNNITLIKIIDDIDDLCLDQENDDTEYDIQQDQNNISDGVQIGGNLNDRNIYYKYLDAKLKYLELKYELL